MVVRIRPGAARAVEAVFLVQLEQCLSPAHYPGLAEDVVQRGEHGGQTGRSMRWAADVDAGVFLRRLGGGQDRL